MLNFFRFVPIGGNLLNFSSIDCAVIFIIEQNLIENNHKIQYRTALLCGGCSTFNFIQYLFKIVVFLFLLPEKVLLMNLTKIHEAKEFLIYQKETKIKLHQLNFLSITSS